MRDLIDRLAIQSWCFRGYKTHEQVIGALRSCGAANLEISNAHVNPVAQSAEELRAVLDTYRRAGVSITSTGLFVISGDEAKSRHAMEFAKLCGARAFTTDILPGGFELAEKLSQEYGIRLAVHNHGRKHRHGPRWALEELLSATSERIGLCLDTAWLIDSGEDPVAFFTKHAARIYGVHVKDFVFDRAGKPADVIVGEGNLRLPEFLAALRQANFAGYFTLEYEGDVNNPVPSTKRCVEAIRAAWKTVEGGQ